MVCNLSEKNSIANQFLLELRDKHVQRDSLRFRTNLERLGGIMAYEISQRLAYETRQVETPMETTSVQVPVRQPVLISILRAGLPYFNGFVALFDKAQCGFIGAGRREEVAGEVSIDLGYAALPSVAGKTVIVIDPMLATGKSVHAAVDVLLKHGQPEHVHIAALVCAPEGIDHLAKNLTVPFTVYTFAVDERLDSRFFIVPGLGDAGDLCFGEKE